MSNLIKEKDGGYWIEIMQDKTNESVRNPVLNPALIIVEKYCDDAARRVHNYVLPRITNQKLNLYLKTIAELVGIEKDLTHHTARHTFATTVTLSNDVPIEIVVRRQVKVDKSGENEKRQFSKLFHSNHLGYVQFNQKISGQSC